MNMLRNVVLFNAYVQKRGDNLRQLGAKVRHLNEYVEKRGVI